MVSKQNEGHAKGQAEGQSEARLQIARNMLSMSIDIDAIAKATGLSVIEIPKLFG